MTWRPHRGQQEKFCRRNEFEVLFGGAAGPGKTENLLMLATRYVQHPAYKALLLRRTFPQLQEIIDRCWTYYPQIGGVYRSTEHRWYFPSGATITLGHMQHEDSRYQYQGKEYHFIGFDELTQFTQTQYLYLLSRARSTVPEIPVRIRATTNPGGIGHLWVKERFITITTPEASFIDPATGLSRTFVPGQIEDNPTLFDNDPEYLARLEALPEVEKLRLRYGIWDAFEGQVFTELNQRLHGCEPFEVPPEWERYCVLDWGFAKPFSVGWWAVDYDGVLYRYREWYGCKEGMADEGLRKRADEVAAGILERERGERIHTRVADPSIWHPRPESRKREARGQTIQQDFSDAGVFFLKADNDRTHGKAQVHQRLRVDREVDPESGEVTDERVHMQVFNSCHHFWRTMPALAEDPKNPEDVDTKQEDHVYDEVRYMAMARPMSPRRVQQVPVGSFTHERQKLIRARKYAMRHGVTLEQAYGRIR